MGATVGFDAYVLVASIMVVMVGSVYLTARMAERRGRRIRTWACIAANIGPLALPLIFGLPDLHRRSGDQA